MRKYVRSILRAQADRKKEKPSDFIKHVFNKLQISKYGKIVREHNMLKGTHRKKNWEFRYQMSTK